MPKVYEDKDSLTGQQKKRLLLKSLEAQQEKLDKLFEKIHKPVYIPESPEEKNTLQAPKDFIRNLSGISTNAGSGDFHVYRAQRSREFQRIKNFDDQERKEKGSMEYIEENVCDVEFGREAFYQKYYCDKQKLAANGNS